MSMSDPKASTLSLLESLTREYYREARLWLPEDFPLREFAVQTWRSSSYIRHLAFSSESQLRRFVVERAPRHLYYSSARYDQPAERDMDAKGWRSADIVFDIDADHIPWCERDTVIVEEPSLGVRASFTPSKCIREAAIQALLLHDVLVNELGFSRSQITIEFSGHRGFHVVVQTGVDDVWGTSDSEVRRELVNYVKAQGLVDDALQPALPPARKRRAVPLPPSPADPGLRGRLARFKSILGRIYGDASEARAREMLGVVVDEQVTVDTKRLLRVPGSLNGKTMLAVVKVRRVEELESFEVSDALSPFGDRGHVRVVALVDTPVVEVLGHRLKLRRGTRMKLPAPLALYLMAKGVAALAR